MAILNPDHVVFVIDKEDGTSIAGVEMFDHARNKTYVDQVVVQREEGKQLAAVLQERMDAQKKLNGGVAPPPPDREYKILRTANGRPVTMEELMGVKKVVR